MKTSAVRALASITLLSALAGACSQADSGPTAATDTTSIATTTSSQVETTTSSLPLSSTTTSTIEEGSLLGPETPLIAVIAGGEGSEMALYDSSTGERMSVIATVEDFLYTGDIDRNADGSVFVYWNWEDYWYSCETYVGHIGVPSNGVLQEVVAGQRPRVSPDGTQLAYLAASECRPDPDEPDRWVVAVTDTIVVRDLNNLEERRWTFPGAIYRSDSPPVVLGIAWSDEDLVAAVGDRLVVIDPEDLVVPDTGSAPLIQAVGKLSGLAGVNKAGHLIASFAEGKVTDLAGRRTRIVELDIDTGRELRALMDLDGWILGMALDHSGEHVAVLGPDGGAFVDGVPLEIQVPANGFIRSLGW